MLGELNYRLEAVNGGYLPKVHGRFMHAAFFAALRDMAPQASDFIHSEMTVKPFTASSLKLAGHPVLESGSYKITMGQQADWRVTVFSDTLIDIMAQLTQGYIIKVGRLSFRLLACTGCQLSEEELLASSCKNAATASLLKLKFLSPTAFRSGNDDYPLPLPEYIWGSLADKWGQLGFELPLEKSYVQAAAAKLIPVNWFGRNERVFFDKQRGVNCFCGHFEYSLKNLLPEERPLIILLAQFGTFSGVGRLTAQGLGQLEVGWR